MKRQFISCASALFFLAVFNCKREKPDPECRDASCCNPHAFEYVEYLVDEPVALTGPPFFSKHAVRFTRNFPSNLRKGYWTNRSAICEKSLYQIEGFPFTYNDQSDPNSFPYRVSGKLLEWTGEKLVDLPVLTLYIDKIEKIN